MTPVDKFLSVTVNHRGTPDISIDVSNFNEGDFISLLSLSETELKNHLTTIGFLPRSIICPICQSELTNLKTERDRPPFFQWRRTTCSRKRIFQYRGTIFHLTKLTIKEALLNFSCNLHVAEL
ncbi:hypothetical protein M153_12740002511 [Pseudoloma neurophilia]|uniref:Uncharacterized protein n=1 Tax=Pseudoloma neurophilia TaxID=146866 RepID=A0A0R0LVD1_9MICR|nr:hypothetical protein M153_12740002511 [Pseudoloma neurophilia]